jgi:acyl-CoA thioester hydrolase
MPAMHVHPLSIYYEDTDHSGVVYHANYLKFFERAREHMLGVAELRRLLEEEGIGFVVYKVELVYREGAVFGDQVEIQSTVDAQSEYRAVFDQKAVRAVDQKLLVEGKLHLVCVDRSRKLVRLPGSVMKEIQASR